MLAHSCTPQDPEFADWNSAAEIRQWIDNRTPKLQTYAVSR